MRGIKAKAIRRHFFKARVRINAEPYSKIERQPSKRRESFKRNKIAIQVISSKGRRQYQIMKGR